MSRLYDGGLLSTIFREKARRASVFIMSQTDQILTNLMAVIQDRKANPPERSYTTSLFAAGVDKIGSKILEEAQEVVDAAREGNGVGHAHLTHEAADLIYHLFVMLGYRGVSLDEVAAELQKRFGTSGLDEKASRTASSS